MKLKPCPFCGETPDPEGPHTFQESDGGKLGGYVVCCCHGPDVRTGYWPVEHWKQAAADAWNERAGITIGQWLLDLDWREKLLLLFRGEDRLRAWQKRRAKRRAGESEES